MQDSEKPKVTVNEDYLDLREHNGNSELMKKTSLSKKSSRKKSKSPVHSFSLQNEGLHYDKELINCGLQNLATSYNVRASMYQKHSPPRRKSCLSENSQTDPRFRKYLRKSPEDNKSLKSKSDVSLISRKISLHQVSSSTPVFLSVNNCVVNTPYQNGRRSNENLKRSVDPRLTKKYSILKVPCWKKSWTIPVFSQKEGLNNGNFNDNFDRQTYLYDEGSEIDSTFIENKPRFLNKVFPVECQVVLLVMGALCGILLASLLIYIIFGNNLMHFFFKPKQFPQPSFKSYIKLFGGGLIYCFTRFFGALGKILSIPSQVQEPPDPFKWRK